MNSLSGHLMVEFQFMMIASHNWMTASETYLVETVLDKPYSGLRGDNQITTLS